MRLLERDEAGLWPRDREFRKDLIRYLNGEVTFKGVFGREASISEVFNAHLSSRANITETHANSYPEPAIIGQTISAPEKNSSGLVLLR